MSQTADVPDPSAQAGFGELLRGNANVRRLWGGTVVSLFGDWFNTLALYRLALDLTGSEAALGGVFLVKLLPLALASPLAGVLVDRVDRKHVMIGADIVRAVIVLGFLFVRDAGDLWLLYTLAAAQIAVSATFTPAKNAILPGIASPRELLTANALLSATWSTMLALGAAAGGPAVDLFGTDAVFLFDAATYLVSAAIIWRIRAPEARRPAVVQASESAVRVAARQIWDGWQYLRRRPDVGRIALAKASWGLGGGGLLLALALVGERLFPGVGTTGIGVLLAARGIGTGIGPILARALVPSARRWPLILGLCIIASGLGYVGIAAAIDVRWVVIACVVFAHAAGGANWVLATTLLQRRAEDDFRGRVFATDWLLVALVESISITAASVMLEAGVTLVHVILTLGGVSVAVGIVWLLTVVPAERRAEAA